MVSFLKVAAGLGAAVVFLVAGLTAAHGDEAPATHKRPGKQIYIELTEDFYRALRDEGKKGYTTAKSDEYLRQIAVSTRFMVETNLRLLQQQERIIDLLQTMTSKSTGKP